MEKKSDENKDATASSKLHNIIEVASALTSLGDNEVVGGSTNKDAAGPVIKEERAHANDDDDDDDDDADNAAKRYLPDYKKPDAAPTFPEKLMNMMKLSETQGDDFCVTWLKDGKSFVIRNPDEFTRSVVPKFFKPTKFSSFTRKLYRWGFRQVNRGIGPDDPIIFGNEFFQRDSLELMSKMRSVTAAGTRKQEQVELPSHFGGMKRSMDEARINNNNNMNNNESINKRMLLENYYMQAKTNPHFLSQGGNINNSNNMFDSTRALDSFTLTSALGPQFPYGRSQNNFMSMGAPSANSFDFVQAQRQRPTNGLLNPYNNLPAANYGASHLQQQNNNNNYQSNSSTADIVNAAIAALRYAN